MNESDSKPPLCSWCQEFYVNCNDLCSGCNLGKQTGYEKHQVKDVKRLFYQAKSDDIENKKKMMDEKVYVRFLDEDIFTNILSAIKKMSINLTPKVLHKILQDIMPEDTPFSWEQAKKLFSLLDFRTVSSSGQQVSNKFDYECVLCERVIDYWNIDGKLMPVGYCYHGQKEVPTSIGEIQMPILHPNRLAVGSNFTEDE